MRTASTGLMPMHEPRIQPAHLSSHILVADIFKDLEPATLHELEAELSTVTIAAGEELFRQGDPGDSLYILVQGRLAVTILQNDGREQVIDELDPGATVGEMALLT